jgi:hypothetical protein
MRDVKGDLARATRNVSTRMNVIGEFLLHALTRRSRGSAADTMLRRCSEHS